MTGGISDDYFDKYIDINKKIETVLGIFESLNVSFSDNSFETIYSSIDNASRLIGVFYMVSWECSRIDDKYDSFIEKIDTYIDRTAVGINDLQKINDKYLDLNYYSQINELRINLLNLGDNAINKAYAFIMEKVGIKENKNGKIDAVKFSPYLYLQILYLYSGSPNAAKDNLLLIDEVQGVSPEEIRLIKEINDNKVKFNMFGDVHQHIENTKGIDKWEEYNGVLDFDLYELNENYRNASQITEFCNNKFNMNMIPINTFGVGVKEVDEKSFNNTLVEKFADIIKEEGLSAIIVKDENDVNYILDDFSDYRQYLLDLVNEDGFVQPFIWNIIKIDDAKGLEFNRVIALSDKMTDNEKYIAYTRALDELIVYSSEINQSHKDNKPDKLKSEEIKNDEQKTEQIYGIDDLLNISNSWKNIKTMHHTNKIESENVGNEVKHFFEKKGCVVIDKRNETGRLWVVGDKNKIEKTVNEAIEKFDISGRYARSSEIGNRNGWFTKTKK